jgi:hypothetical protein
MMCVLFNLGISIELTKFDLHVKSGEQANANLYHAIFNFLVLLESIFCCSGTLCIMFLNNWIADSHATVGASANHVC